MQTSRQFLELLLERRDLGRERAAQLLGLLMRSETVPAVAGALLAALRCKGVTAAEVGGFVDAMLGLARRLDLPTAPDAVDIVGTGGDASGSLNLSTGAALLAAACGLPVIKHGNRSISSRSGSADLMERLGFTLPLDEDRAKRCFLETGFTFLFAPYFHPAMQTIAAVRAALGVRTVFNLLGPLTNPAGPRFRLIGAYDAATAELMAGTLAGMGVERAWVVHGAGGWDEATPMGPFLAFEVARGAVHRQWVDPAGFGLARCAAAALAGGDAAANLQALHAVFDGRDRGAHRAALVLQAGIALHIGDRAASVAAGIDQAGAALDSGRAQDWLRRLCEFAAETAAT